MTNEAQSQMVNRPGRSFPSVVFFAMILLIGAIGGIAGTIVASNNPIIKGYLGYDNSGASETRRTEKVIVEESSAIIDATKKVSPSVVSISTKRNVTDLFGQTITQEGGGTGFIITNDGLIVTNKHVVSDTKASYTVFTADGKDYPAEILDIDEFQDLAVIKIKASGLPVVELGDSDQLQVGQYVIAIGNALGQFQNTVTVGVISAKERQIEAGDGEGGATEKLEGLLQTDAAINQGNSGGPLVNVRGQVIGLNTAVAAKGQAEGIGFAIPINAVRNSINQVKKTGKIIRPYLGVRYVPITKEIAQINDLPVNDGAYIIGNETSPAVIKDSPADKVGLKSGDILTTINGQKINEQKSLTRLLGQYNVGDTVEVTYIRDKKTATVKVALEELK